jgi:hypothetical protein
MPCLLRADVVTDTFGWSARLTLMHRSSPEQPNEISRLHSRAGTAGWAMYFRGRPWRIARPGHR